MDAARAVYLSVDSEQWIVQVKWVCLDEAEIAWESLQHIYENART